MMTCKFRYHIIRYDGSNLDRIMYSDMPPEFSDGLCVQDGLQKCHVEFQEMAFPCGSKFITGKSTWVSGRYIYI